MSLFVTIHGCRFAVHGSSTAAPLAAPKNRQNSQDFPGFTGLHDGFVGRDLTQKIMACKYAVRTNLDGCCFEKVNKMQAVEADDPSLKISLYIPLSNMFKLYKNPVNPEESC